MLHISSERNNFEMNVKEFLKKITENKKLLKLLWVLCFILLVFLYGRYKVYKTAKAFYNTGVDLYKSEDYEKAEEYFNYALAYKKTKRFECKVRINKALSITTPITPESVTPENLDEKIARLEEARDVLTAHDCAHENDSRGHSRKAQKLKEEIDAYIEYLKEQNPPQEENDDDDGGGSDEDQKQKEQEEKEEKRKKEEQELLKEKFNQIEQQGLNQRNTNLELYEEWSKDLDFYSGKSW